MCHCVCWLAPFMIVGEKLGADGVRLMSVRGGGYLYRPATRVR